MNEGTTRKVPTGLTERDLVELRLLSDQRAAVRNNNANISVDVRRMSDEQIAVCLGLLRRHHAQERRKAIPNFGFMRDWQNDMQRYEREVAFRERKAG